MLGKSREVLRQFGENSCHALLFLDDKLVSRFSCRNAPPVTKKNVFQIALLMQAMRETQEIGDAVEPSPVVSDEEERCYNGDVDSDQDEPLVALSACHTASRQHAPSVSRFRPSNPFVTTDNDTMPFEACVVFLNASETSSVLLPFSLRVTRVTPSLSLAILSETRSMDLAHATQVLLDMLTTVQYRRRELHGFISLQRLERAVARFKKNSKTPIAQHVVRSLEKLVSGDFRKWMLELGTAELPSTLDALCSSICSSLREFYHSGVYVRETQRMDTLLSKKDVLSHLDWTRIYFEQRARDYLDYLTVKAARNMTLEPFLPMCPNLVAFIYVDRVRNEVVYAASEDSDLDASGDRHLSQANLFRTILPEAVERAYSGLAVGDLSSKWTLAERDLCLSYAMWFEDLSGRHLMPQQVDFTLQHYPSMVGTNFVQEVIGKVFSSTTFDYDLFDDVPHRAIACFELLLVQRQAAHSSKNDTDHIKLLAAKLWDVTSTWSLQTDRLQSLS